MRTIDFSHKITPRKVIFAKIKKKFFFESAAAKFTPFKKICLKGGGNS